MQKAHDGERMPCMPKGARLSVHETMTLGVSSCKVCMQLDGYSNGATCLHTVPSAAVGPSGVLAAAAWSPARTAAV